jgi:hypothetical protein
MKELEKVLREHREAFDDHDPGSDHFENFLEKLEQRTKKELSIWDVKTFKSGNNSYFCGHFGDYRISDS